MEERVLPHSVDAERAALGAWMTDPARLGPLAVRMGLEEEAFYVPAHRLVAGALLAMEEERLPVDVLLVQRRLERMGKLDVVGGMVGLCALLEAAVTATHGEYYLEQVLDLWLLRRQISLCWSHAGKCFGQQEMAQAMLAELVTEVSGLGARGPAEVTNLERMNESLALWRALKNKERAAAGLELPWKALGDLTSGLEVGLTIVAGRPGAGKSTIEGLMCEHVAALGVPVGRVTLDMTGRDLLDRLLCKRAGVSLKKLKAGYAREDQLARVEEARDSLAKLPMFINDRDREVKRICAWARALKQRQGLGLLTVDFIQKVQVAGMRDAYDQTKKVTVVTDMLKSLAFELKIPVVALSQLSREGEKAQRDPRLTDLRDSGSIEQDASKVLMVYPDAKLVNEMEREEPGQTERKRPVQVDVQKQQNGGHGRVLMWFLPAYFQMDEAEDAGSAGGSPAGELMEWEAK